MVTPPWHEDRVRLLEAVLYSNKILTLGQVKMITEQVLQRPVMTHEYADLDLLIREARERFAPQSKEYKRDPEDSYFG